MISRSAGSSWMFQNRGAHVVGGDYAPRSAVEIFVKDLGIVEDIARAERFPAPLAGTALQLFLMTASAGMGRDDDASVARLYAKNRRSRATRWHSRALAAARCSHARADGDPRPPSQRRGDAREGIRQRGKQREPCTRYGNRGGPRDDGAP